jgi:di/tricarboxylate transporter
MTITIITLIVTIAFFIWGRIRSDIVAMAALIVLTATGVLTTEEALSGFSSPIVIMMVGLFVVGGAILQTGLAQTAGNKIAGLAKGNETRAFILVMLATSLTTMFISNTATAVLMAPIALVAAQQTGLSPYPFIFAVTLGASMCFASPFSTSPNALVMKAGHYTFMDYIRVGLPLQIIIGIVMVFVLPLLFPFKG